MTAHPPATGQTVPPAVSAREFRDLMRNVTGAVSIIASGPVGERSGLTATAVCSVSDQPPTLLVCVNRAATSREVIARTGSFSVNVLGANCHALATHFSGRTGASGEGKFDAGAWTTLATGAPILTSALAAFDCEVVDIKDVATHSIVIGRVIAGKLGPAGAPLLYARGAYWMPPV